jgi:outer membrane protein assembly factor BamD (BamD/ComL family)
MRNFIGMCMPFTLFMLVSFISCASGPINIPEDIQKEPAKLIQLGQEASDREQYDIALQYYKAVLAYNSERITYVCAAEYEIGFIYYKQKKYDEARAQLQALQARYTDPESGAPPEYNTLAELVLEKIPQEK